MRQQHLDANGVEWGMLMPLNRGPGNQRNLDYGAALATAVNDWQIEKWCRARAAPEGLDRRGAGGPAGRDRARSSGAPTMPASRRSCCRRARWSRSAAAATGRSSRPRSRPSGHLALHVGGINGYPATPSGWPSYYIEEQHTNVQGMQGLVTSLVVEGVFERFPQLKVVLVEGGIAWLPALKWRLDKHWKRLKAEAPHLKRLPSEYIRDHIYLTTQPLDEPAKDSDLAENFGQVGYDRIMFSTDYPHWDMDEPRFVLSKLRIDKADQDRIIAGNAKELYKLT